MSRRIGFFAILLFAGALGVSAGPTHEIWDKFYDCSLNENGWRDTTCGGQIYSGGTLSGAYRFREYYDCTTYQSTYQWYYWNGSGWTAFSGPPGPNC